MAQEFALTFYRSRAWRKCRATYVAMRVAIDGGMCEICHDAPGVIVHHKVRLTPENIKDPTVTLNWQKLQYDCIECHNRIYNTAAVAEGLVFDAEGNVIEVPTPRLGEKSDPVATARARSE